jgi:hypothetical protein
MINNKFIKELAYLFQKPYTQDKMIDKFNISILGIIWVYTLQYNYKNK